MKKSFFAVLLFSILSVGVSASESSREFGSSFEERTHDRVESFLKIKFLESKEAKKGYHKSKHPLQDKDHCLES